MISLDVITHGAKGALEMYGMEKRITSAAMGAGVGIGAVFVAENIMDHLTGNSDGEQSVLSTAAEGALDGALAWMAISLLATNPEVMSSVGMATLMGIPAGLITHTLEGEVCAGAMCPGLYAEAAA